MYKTHSLFSLLLVSCFLSTSFADLSAAPLPRKARKQIINETETQLVKPVTARLNELRSQFETLRGEERSKVERFRNELRVKENETRNTLRDNTEELDLANSDFTRAQSNEIAIDYIEPYQAYILDLADLFREQSGIIQGPGTLSGAVQNRRNTVSTGVRELEDDFRNFRSLNQYLDNALRDIVNELKSISSGNIESRMPFGRQVYVEKTALDLQFILSAIASLPSYLHNQNLDGSFAPARVVGSADTIPSFRTLLDQVVDNAESAATFQVFNQTVQQTLEVEYYGNNAEAGSLAEWQNAIVTLQNNINFLNNEINNARDNNQFELERIFSLEKYQLEREREFVFIQRRYALEYHGQALRDSRAIASILSNENTNGPDAWRRAPLVVKDNLNFVMERHNRIFQLMHDLVSLALSEFTQLSFASSNEEELKTLAGRIANKIESIQIGGGLDTTDEQLTSIINAMSLLKTSEAQGNLSSEFSISTWIFSIDAKHAQYQFDRFNTIP